MDRHRREQGPGDPDAAWPAGESGPFPAHENLPSEKDDGNVSAGEHPQAFGVRLIHFANKTNAVHGDVLTYFAWIINESDEELTKVTLVLRSFTNAGMENLHYTSEPTSLSLTDMPHGGEAQFVFTYVVTENDEHHGGELVSAMAVQAVTASGTKLSDECDAITPLA
ncbi:hypothetical protein [Arthrobacter sp. GAS37]|uniref:hypothetical protein n=1 Tax=Arthrobacter sp. GAS37 TaxID=3156261 RepID=UPI00384C5EFB